MKKKLVFFICFAFIFFQCKKEPTITEAIIRLVDTRGVPIVGHEMLLIKKSPGNSPVKTDPVVEKKLTNVKGEVVFNYTFEYYDYKVENWFVIANDTANVVPYNFYWDKTGGLPKQNFSIVLDTIAPIRVRYKNPTPNMVKVSTSADAGLNTGLNPFIRYFGGHNFNLGAVKDTTVSYNAYKWSTFNIFVSKDGSNRNVFLYNGGLERDSVFIITL